ncbi:MAG: response regulator [Sphingobacteriaceae bacterium]|nr:response regulator [Sphingobacteriaceae bacterium]
MSAKLVYILEDDPDISEIVAFILTDAGYDTKEYGTAALFQAAISERLPDIIILDVLLPDGNGLEICKQLQKAENTSKIPILMMSANRTKREIEESGCNADFISKPFDIDHFRQQVDLIA